MSKKQWGIPRKWRGIPGARWKMGAFASDGRGLRLAHHNGINGHFTLFLHEEITSKYAMEDGHESYTWAAVIFGGNGKTAGGEAVAYILSPLSGKGQALLESPEFFPLRAMDLITRIRCQFEESIRVKQEAAEGLAAPVAAAVSLMTETLLNDGRLLACGNGGSAADAQHFAAELVGRFERERQGLAAIALTTDTSILTALGNDYAFEQIFARQVAALGHAGDALLAISTSGNSGNILNAIDAAHAHGMPVVALTGGDGGRVAKTLSARDIHLNVPAKRTARVQEVHLLILHCLCDGIDSLLMGAEECSNPHP
jgi:D-sedoheptulose 7-phosphate isomerase